MKTRARVSPIHTFLLLLGSVAFFGAIVWMQLAMAQHVEGARRALYQTTIVERVGLILFLGFGVVMQVAVNVLIAVQARKDGKVYAGFDLVFLILRWLFAVTLLLNYLWWVFG